MIENSDPGKLPGWTLLVSVAGWALALVVLWACRDSGLSWWIGVPLSLVAALAGVFSERAIERKYLPSQRNN